MPTHMKLTTPMGTLYSSTMPVMRSGLPANSADAHAKASAGMRTMMTPRMISRCKGWRNTCMSWRNVLLSEPWNVMMANMRGPTAETGPKICGSSTPTATHAGTQIVMWLWRNDPSC